jgi:7-carboxy-7-deazaguanine synthase
MLRGRVRRTTRWPVLTGGEPLLQAVAALIEALKARGFYIAVETNGTRALPAPLDWACVGPKADVPLVLHVADRLRLVYLLLAALPGR